PCWPAGRRNIALSVVHTVFAHARHACRPESDRRCFAPECKCHVVDPVHNPTLAPTRPLPARRWLPAAAMTMALTLPPLAPAAAASGNDTPLPLRPGAAAYRSVPARPNPGKPLPAVAPAALWHSR